MTSMSSRQVREQIDLPIIDVDGQCAEFSPAAVDPYLREALRSDTVQAVQRRKPSGHGRWPSMDLQRPVSDPCSPA